MARLLARLAATIVAFGVGVVGKSLSYDELKRSVVRITSQKTMWYWSQPYDTNRHTGSVGSGFIVNESPLMIMTCAHVVDNADGLLIQIPEYGQQKFKASVATICNDADVALLLFDDEAQVKRSLAQDNVQLHAIPFQSNSPPLGSEVVAPGFPLGQTTMKLSTGVISGVDHVEFHYRNLAIQSTAIISSGNSGSPLLDKANLNVVGMNYAKMPSESQINYVVPLWRLHHVMNKHKEVHGDSSKPPEKPFLFHLVDPGIVLTPSTPAFYERENKGCSSGALISDVQSHSPFAKAQPSIPVDSFLIAINDIQLDRYGQGANKEYVNELVDYTDLMWMRPGTGEEDIKVTVCNGETGQLQHSMVSTKWTKEHNGKGIHWVYEPRHEGVDWEIFGDLLFMDLTENHIDLMAGEYHSWALVRFMEPQKLAESQLAVMLVRGGGDAQEALGLSNNVLAVVDTINGKKVRSLDDFRLNFLPEKLNVSKSDFHVSIDKLSDSLKGMRSSSFMQRGSKAQLQDSIWSLRTDVGTEYATKFKQTLATQIMAAHNGGQHFLLTAAPLAAASHLGMLGHEESASLLEKKAPLVGVGAVDDEAALASSPLLVTQRRGQTEIVDIPKEEVYMNWRD